MYHAWSFLNVALASFFLFPANSYAIEMRDVGERLVARRDSLPEGAVSFTGLVAVMPRADFDKLRQLILDSESIIESDKVVRILTEFCATPGIERITAYEAHLYYRNQEPPSWRMKRTRLEEFAHEGDRLKREAEKIGARVMEPTRTEDVAFTGDHVELLQDNQQLWYRAKSAETDYVRQGDLDISLMEWKMMLEQGAAPGQKIVASEKGSEVGLDFVDESGAAAYYFSKELGYAPTRVVVKSGQNVLTEVLYAYAPGDRTSATPATPRISAKVDLSVDGKAKIDVFIVHTWGHSVSDADLKVVLPAKYLMLDERLGGRPIMVVRDASGETHIQDPSFGDKVATAPASMPKASDVSPTSTLPSRKPSVPSTVLWVFGGLVACVAAWGVWRLANRKARV